MCVNCDDGSDTSSMSKKAASLILSLLYSSLALRVESRNHEAVCVENSTTNAYCVYSDEMVYWSNHKQLILKLLVSDINDYIHQPTI